MFCILVQMKFKSNTLKTFNYVIVSIENKRKYTSKDLHLGSGNNLVYYCTSITGKLYKTCNFTSPCINNQCSIVCCWQVLIITIYNV